MYIKPLPSQQYLHECFKYRDGVLIGKIRPRSHFATNGGFAVSATRNSGNPVGYINDKGYLEIMLTVDGKRKRFAAHRIVWTMFHGKIPEGYLVDHEDTNRLNLKIENLRLTLGTGNSQNSSLFSNNTTGAKCVFYDKRRGNFYVQIMANGKKTCVGTFSTIELAEQAAKTARDKLHGDFSNHGNKIK